MRVEGPHEDEPYFTVLTDPKFLRANLTDEARREFFAGGETLVDFMLRSRAHCSFAQFSTSGRFSVSVATEPFTVEYIVSSCTSLSPCGAGDGAGV